MGVQAQVGRAFQYNYYATKCAFATSLDGTNWVPVEDGRLFDTGLESDKEAYKSDVRFTYPVTAKFVRIHMDAAANYYPCMRAGVLVL